MCVYLCVCIIDVDVIVWLLQIYYVYCGILQYIYEHIMT